MQVSEIIEVFLISLFLSSVLVAISECILLYRKDEKFDISFLAVAVVLAFSLAIVILIT